MHNKHKHSEKVASLSPKYQNDIDALLKDVVVYVNSEIEIIEEFFDVDHVLKSKHSVKPHKAHTHSHTIHKKHQAPTLRRIDAQLNPVNHYKYDENRNVTRKNSFFKVLGSITQDVLGIA